MTEALSRQRALRIISALRSGTPCLDSVSLFSAGRESLYRAAETLFEEVEETRGAGVRWIKGQYGTGKTHSFARLIEIALRRRWVYSYVQVGGRGDAVQLQKFDSVLSAVLRNLCLDGPGVAEGSADGWQQVLDGWVCALKTQVGWHAGADLPSMKFDDAVNATLALLHRDWGIFGAFGAALRQYALAARDGDIAWQQLLRAWFDGQDVLKIDAQVRARFRSSGILEKVSLKNAKLVLRQVSAFLRYRGYRGMLLLLDEVENVLAQPKGARKAAYTLLRELIDNVDDRHGMTCTLFYLSGTPDLFDGPQGIVEYEALASRALPPSPTATSNPAGLVVDLAHFPISRDDLLEISRRITALYAVVRGVDIEAGKPGSMAELLSLIEGRAGGLPSPRSWVRSVVEHLETASRG